jgi:hypothetical protein
MAFERGGLAPASFNPDTFGYLPGKAPKQSIVSRKLPHSGGGSSRSSGSASRRRRSSSGGGSSRSSNAYVRRASNQATIRSNSSGHMSRPAIPHGGGTGHAPGLGRSGGTGRSGGVGAPSVDSYLRGDSTYLQQQSQFSKTLADFLANEGTNKNKLNMDFQTAGRALGDQRTTDLQNLMEDFASRGLLKSGEYGTAVGDYNKGYGQRVTDLGTQHTNQLNDLTQQEAQFRREQTLQNQTARQQALQRRAAKYGV